MLHQVAVIDPESFWDAFNPLAPPLLLGWSISEADGGIALVPRGSRRGGEACDSVYRPSIRRWAPVDSPCRHNPVVSTDDVRIGRPAEAKERSF